MILLGLTLVAVGNLLPRTRPNVALGIRTSKRDRTALSIEYDTKSLSPGHRQLSCEPELRSNLYSGAARLNPCGQGLITRPGQHSHNPHDRQYYEELCQTPALFLYLYL